MKQINRIAKIIKLDEDGNKIEKPEVEVENVEVKNVLPEKDPLIKYLIAIFVILLIICALLFYIFWPKLF